jgi:anti-sigma regulatory factor (Ser/Thr protein kinase)
MEKSFRRQMESLSSVFAFLDDCLAAFDGGPESSYIVKFAVEEFFTNMVKYSPEGKEDIAVSVSSDGTRVSVCLMDRDVEPFDVTAGPDPSTNLPLEQRTPGGLGIYLVKQMVDSLQYSYVNRCSRITFSKLLER